MASMMSFFSLFFFLFILFLFPFSIYSLPPNCVIKQTLRVGKLFTRNGTSASALLLAQYGKTAPIIAEMFLKHIENDKCGLGNTGIAMEWYGINIEGNTARISSAMNELIYGRNVSIIIAPESSFVGAAAAIANTAGVPIIAGMGGANSLFRNGRQRPYKTLFSPLTPSLDYFSPAWPIANLRGYKTIGVVTTDFPVYSDVCLGSLDRAKRDFDMTHVKTFIVPTNSTFPTVQHNQFRQRMREMKEFYRPDILVTCYAAACDVLYDTLVAIDFNPLMHLTFECVNSMPTVVPMNDDRQRQLTLARYSISPTQFDPSLRGDQFRDDPERQYANMFAETKNTTVPSAMQFYQAYQAWPGASSFSSLTASELAAYYVIEYAVYKTQSTDRALLLRALETLNIKGSFFGLLTADEYGQNSLRPIPLSQLGAADDKINAALVAPQSAAKYVILPIPQFNERQHVPSLMTTAVTGILVIVVCFTCINLACIVLLVKYRSTPAIRSKKALFTVLISTCSIFLYWAVLTWLPDGNTDFTCRIQRPFFLLSSTSLFTVIAAITQRIAKIFLNTKLQVVSSKDHDLVKWIIILLIPSILASIFLISLTPSTPELKILDPYRPVYNYIECSEWPFSVSIVYILLLGFYMCLAIYYAIKVRGIGSTYSVFNDARRIAMLSFVSNLVYAVMGIVQFAFINPAVYRQSWFVIRSMFLLLVPFVATMLWCVFPLYEAIYGTDINSPYTVTTEMNQTKLAGDGYEGGGRKSGNNNNNINAIHPIIKSGNSHKTSLESGGGKPNKDNNIINNNNATNNNFNTNTNSNNNHGKLVPARRSIGSISSSNDSKTKVIDLLRSIPGRITFNNPGTINNVITSDESMVNNNTTYNEIQQSTQQLIDLLSNPSVFINQHSPPDLASSVSPRLSSTEPPHNKSSTSPCSPSVSDPKLFQKRTIPPSNHGKQ